MAGYKVAPVCFQAGSVTRVKKERQGSFFPSATDIVLTRLVQQGAHYLHYLSGDKPWHCYLAFSSLYFFIALWISIFAPCNTLLRPTVNEIRIRLSKSFYVYELLSQISCACLFLHLNKKYYAEPMLNKSLSVIFYIVAKAGFIKWSVVITWMKLN